MSDLCPYYNQCFLLVELSKVFEKVLDVANELDVLV